MEMNYENEIKKIIDFHFPRFSELPKVPLYKDQVIIYIESKLMDIKIYEDENLLTPTMLNNYVKQKVIAAPIDKKYDEQQLAYLIIVCILKQVFSLKEVSELIKIQMKSYPIEPAYDYFCIEFESALKVVFSSRDYNYPSKALTKSFESEIVRSAIMAFVNKIFIQRYLVKEF